MRSLALLGAAVSRITRADIDRFLTWPDEIIVRETRARVTTGASSSSTLN